MKKSSIVKTQTHSKFSFALLAAVVILASSCGKETADPTFDVDEKLELKDMPISIQNLSSNFATRDGALHFTDTSNYSTHLEKIMELSDVEFKEFEKFVGFRSLSTVLEEAYEAFDELKTESDLQAWKNKYGDVVELRDSVVTPLIRQTRFQRLANRSGEYHFGGAYAKVTEQQVIIITDGDKSKLKSAAKLNVSDNKNGILILDFPPFGRDGDRTSESSTSQSRDVARCQGGWLSAMRQEGKRKVFIDFYIYPNPFPGGKICTEVEVVAAGHKKTLFGWNKYKSQYCLSGMTYAFIDGKGNPQAEVNLSHATNPTYGDEYQHPFIKMYFDHSPPAEYIVPDGFSSAQGRATSRGTNPYWAVVCCIQVPYACPSDFGYFTW